MKVLLLGGYGVFGERLARLLVRDGHAVTIAGRDLGAAERLATEIGAGALRMDRAGATAHGIRMTTMRTYGGARPVPAP